MLDQCFERPHVARRLRANPLVEDIERLAAYLHDRGHAREVTKGYLRSAEHFGRWLHRERIAPTDLDSAIAKRFLEHHLPRCRCSAPAPRHRATMHATLRHLLQLRPVPARRLSDAKAPTPIEKILTDFDRHMRATCGLAPATRRYRSRYVREFLQSVAERRPLRIDKLTVKDPMCFITEYARRCSPATARVAAPSIRAFLRFLQVRGQCGQQVVNAVPSVPGWRLGTVPRTLSEEQVERLLESFDRTTTMGRRDYGMAVCMLELGLRASEVSHLRLDDIDWRRSTLRVRSVKARRGNLLPLPQRVGQCIADYLRHGRPFSRHANVFVHHRAPVGAAAHATLVRGAMRRAYQRCGFDSQWTGTHMLRHTAASRMIQHGATLKEIADILGHRSIDTTAIYSKVDLPMLSTVALPWPEVSL